MKKKMFKIHLKKKKKINLEEYKKGKYVNNKQALAVTYSQVLKKIQNVKNILVVKLINLKKKK